MDIPQILPLMHQILCSLSKVKLFKSPSDTSVDLSYIIFLSSFVQVQKFQDEEIAYSIQICESLLDETPCVVAMEVFEKI